MYAIFSIGLLATVTSGYLISEVLIPLTNQSSVCYGPGTHGMFRPICPNNTVIAIHRLMVGAKLKNDNCPALAVKYNESEVIVGSDNREVPLDMTKCCFPDVNKTEEERCSYEYDYYNTSDAEYHRKCSGYNKCKKDMEVSWAPRLAECSEDHMEYSNYMYMEYSCINETRIEDICSNNTKTSVPGKPLYLQTNNYPDSANGVFSSCVCQVNFTTKSLTINTLDVRLRQQQTLNIIGDTNITFDSDNEPGFNGTTLNQTSNFSILFTNGGNDDGGNIWIGLESYEVDYVIDIVCESTLKIITTTSLPSDTASATTNTIHGLTSSTTNIQSNDTSSQTSQPPPSPSSSSAQQSSPVSSQTPPTALSTSQSTASASSQQTPSILTSQSASSPALTSKRTTQSSQQQSTASASSQQTPSILTSQSASSPALTSKRTTQSSQQQSTASASSQQTPSILTSQSASSPALTSTAQPSQSPTTQTSQVPTIPTASSSTRTSTPPPPPPLPIAIVVVTVAAIVAVVIVIVVCCACYGWIPCKEYGCCVGDNIDATGSDSGCGEGPGTGGSGCMSSISMCCGCGSGVHNGACCGCCIHKGIGGGLNKSNLSFCLWCMCCLWLPFGKVAKMHPENEELSETGSSKLVPFSDNDQKTLISKDPLDTTISRDIVINSEGSKVTQNLMFTPSMPPKTLPPIGEPDNNTSPMSGHHIKAENSITGKTEKKTKKKHKKHKNREREQHISNVSGEDNVAVLKDVNETEKVERKRRKKHRHRDQATMNTEELFEANGTDLHNNSHAYASSAIKDTDVKEDSHLHAPEEKDNTKKIRSKKKKKRKHRERHTSECEDELQSHFNIEEKTDSQANGPVIYRKDEKEFKVQMIHVKQITENHHETITDEAGICHQSYA